jgi:hypothetical protein
MNKWRVLLPTPNEPFFGPNMTKFFYNKSYKKYRKYAYLDGDKLKLVVPSNGWGSRSSYGKPRTELHEGTGFSTINGVHEINVTMSVLKLSFHKPDISLLQLHTPRGARFATMFMCFWYSLDNTHGYIRCRSREKRSRNFFFRTKVIFKFYARVSNKNVKVYLNNLLILDYITAIDYEGVNYNTGAYTTRNNSIIDTTEVGIYYLSTRHTK